MELLDLRAELEGKEEKYEVDKGKKKDTAQGLSPSCLRAVKLGDRVSKPMELMRLVVSVLQIN